MGVRDASRRAKERLERALGRDAVSYDGAELPPPSLRSCGVRFRDDATFLESADGEAERLATQLGIDAPSHVLDVGCGAGRLPIGLVRRIGELDSYHGVDLNSRAIDWCRRHIEARHPTYRFHLVGAHHARYNPQGTPMDDEFDLPVPTAFFDLVYLHSVIANMIEPDVDVLARIFRRVLRQGGMLFFTAFAEDDVPPVTVNPTDYIVESAGVQNIVRYERGHLLSIFERHGFVTDRLDHGSELDGQSAVYMRPAAT
jgi:SAM-dependent methyltransferase